MPTYDYRCDANGQTIEVKHRINEQLSTWGELCKHAAIAPGDTPANAPISKLATGGQIVNRSNLGSAPPCQSSAPCCSPGTCGLN